ncbi:MAG: ribosomal RNA small subunit methyltransferase A, partial [Rhodospirillaceae bacterium]|nr:ribosomal RNA small subunit methyltransferase A [Rhodospirillaceae bacterium]
ALLRAGAENVIALEKDRRGMDALRSLVTVADGRLTVIEGDAMKQDLATIAPGRLIVVGNLPFNIATELLMRLAEGSDQIDRMVLMFQKEVGDRIAAKPGSKSYGRLSVMVQWMCEVESCFDVPPSAFVPAPKVSATVLRITPRAQTAFPATRESLRAVTAAAFGQRRKTMRNALKPILDDPEAALVGAGLSPSIRAERIDLAGFCSLAREFEARTK